MYHSFHFFRSFNIHERLGEFQWHNYLHLIQIMFLQYKMSGWWNIFFVRTWSWRYEFLFNQVVSGSKKTRTLCLWVEKNWGETFPNFFIAQNFFQYHFLLKTKLQFPFSILKLSFFLSSHKFIQTMDEAFTGSFNCLNARSILKIKRCAL